MPSCFDTGITNLAEFFEHGSLIFRRDADPGVPHRHLDPIDALRLSATRPPSVVNLTAFEGG